MANDGVMRSTNFQPTIHILLATMTKLALKQLKTIAMARFQPKRSILILKCILTQQNNSNPLMQASLLELIKLAYRNKKFRGNRFQLFSFHGKWYGTYDQVHQRGQRNNSIILLLWFYSCRNTVQKGSSTKLVFVSAARMLQAIIISFHITLSLECVRQCLGSQKFLYARQPYDWSHCYLVCCIFHKLCVDDKTHLNLSASNIK